MTPKEKAKNLIDKFTPVARIYPDVDKDFYLTNDAKQCALIALDEILNTCIESMIYYWEEVKQEIEAL